MNFKNPKNIDLAVNIFNLLRSKENEVSIDKKIAIAEALNCSLGELLQKTK